MLTFKQKRRYRFLATFFTSLCITSCLLFFAFLMSIFTNFFGFELGSTTYKIFALSGFSGLLMIIMASYLFSKYYETLRYEYLRKLKTYRLNRHFHLIVYNLTQGRYDKAISMYNDLIPDNTDQGTILYGAFLFVLQHSKNPEHIKLSKQHTLNVLKRFSYHNIF